jgi:predicted nuclease with TOPRIM domain
MRKPTLAQQVATLDALLTAERAAHAETRKQIAEALVVAPDGALEAANEEIADLKTEIEDLKEATAKLAAEKESIEDTLNERDEELEAAQDQIDANTEYEPAFMIALEMLGMTEHEFHWSKRASDCLTRMPELAHVGSV